MGYEANRFVETSARTFSLIEHLADAGTVGVTELARELDMSKGIVHNHLSTLRELGYVTKGPDGYRLSPEFHRISQQRRATSSLYQYSRSAVDRLSSQFETTAFLVEQHDDRAIVVHTARVLPSPKIEVGESIPLSSSLVGVTMLICQAERDSGVEPVSDPYDIEALTERIDAQGYVRGSMTAAGSDAAVAVPILDDNDRCRGGVSVVLPEDLAEAKERRLVDEVLTARERIQQRFSSEWDAKRTFATEKHAWFSG